MSFTPSMSRLAVAHACVYPWTGGVCWPKSEFSAAARYGTAVSLVAERLATGSPAQLTDGAPTDVAAIAAEQDVSDELPRLLRDSAAIAELLSEPCTWRKAETPLALDAGRGTARELRSKGPRDYSDLRPGEIAGTPDLVFVVDGVLTVRDYKTGQYTRHLRPRDSAQLRALGLAAALAYGSPRVHVELVQLDDGVAAPRGDMLDEWDLDVVRGELVALDARLAEHPPVPRPGRHCTEHFCPLVAVCPATRAALAAVDRAAALEHPLVPAITSPEHAASVRVRLKMVESATKEIRGALEAYVRENGAIEIEPGLFYGPVQCDGSERIDLGVVGAEPAVRAALGEHVAEALEVKTSKAAIERAARAATKTAERGAATRLREELYEELRRLGALRQGPPFVRLEEYRKQ